ncbi:hypothetical protein HK096_002332, partial [Nowakowskiella sp. JEL0078]
MTCSSYPNHTGLVPPGAPEPNMTSIGVVKNPCNLVGLPGKICALRIWHDYSTAKSVYARLIDPKSVTDL